MLRVLLIQPERIFMAVNSHALRKNGYEVFRADNGEGAIQCVRRLNPEIIICSYWVRPTDEDLALVETLRSLTKDTAIFVIVRENVLDCVTDLVDNGASLVVSDSLGVQEIVDLVDRTAHVIHSQRTSVPRKLKLLTHVAGDTWHPPTSMADAVHSN